jgi:hypothetical protein
VAAWSKALVCGRSIAGIVGSNLAGSLDVCLFVCCECCMLSCRGLCLRLITRQEDSYRVSYFWVWWWSFGNEEALFVDIWIFHLFHTLRFNPLITVHAAYLNQNGPYVRTNFYIAWHYRNISPPPLSVQGYVCSSFTGCLWMASLNLTADLNNTSARKCYCLSPTSSLWFLY